MNPICSTCGGRHTSAEHETLRPAVIRFNELLREHIPWPDLDDFKRQRIPNLTRAQEYTIVDALIKAGVWR